jgi:hypothetical protein
LKVKDRTIAVVENKGLNLKCSWYTHVSLGTNSAFCAKLCDT